MSAKKNFPAPATPRPQVTPGRAPTDSRPAPPFAPCSGRPAIPRPACARPNPQPRPGHMPAQTPKALLPKAALVPGVPPARPNAAVARGPHPRPPQPAPQPARASKPAVAIAAARPLPTPPAPNARRAAVQPSVPRVIQAIKFYPNLHPGAVERVDPGSVFKLSSFTDQYRLQKTGSHGVYVPNQQYNFVRTQAGEMLVHNRYRHPSIAQGQHVLYAGEVFFNNGRLEWWSNGSGHYQPDAEDAKQAALPLDQFFTYQQIIKGEHKRKRERQG